MKIIKFYRFYTCSHLSIDDCGVTLCGKDWYSNACNESFDIINKNSKQIQEFIGLCKICKQSYLKTLKITNKIK